MQRRRHACARAESHDSAGPVVELGTLTRSDVALQRRRAGRVHVVEDAKRALDDVLPKDASRFTRSLAHAADDYTEEADALIGRHAKGWTIERIAPLEKAVMRVALTEMLYPDVVPGENPIPPEGAIDEAVETAKTFCGAESPKFVNGVLNAALEDIRQTRNGHG